MAFCPAASSSGVQLGRFRADAERGQVSRQNARNALSHGLSLARQVEHRPRKGRGERISIDRQGFVRLLLHSRKDRLHIGSQKRGLVGLFECAERRAFLNEVPLAHENARNYAAFGGAERGCPRRNERAEHGDAVVDVLRPGGSGVYGKRGFLPRKQQNNEQYEQNGCCQQTDAPGLFLHGKHLRGIGCPD